MRAAVIGMLLVVMAGLVPAINVFLMPAPQYVDARHEAGHDEVQYDA
jgi:hypothetical protein